jgi:hypothetical protein
VRELRIVGISRFGERDICFADLLSHPIGVGAVSDQIVRYGDIVKEERNIQTVTGLQLGPHRRTPVELIGIGWRRTFRQRGAAFDLDTAGRQSRESVVALYLAKLGGPEFQDPDNVGQPDLILSLEWVQHNITQFGGDPSRVLVLGESGGGAKNPAKKTSLAE